MTSAESAGDSQHKGSSVLSQETLCPFLQPSDLQVREHCE